MPILTEFVGTWSGHTRLLTISNSGLGKESISDGCCTSVLDLTFQLSDPQGIGVKKARATATVTAVRLGPGWYANTPPPVVGQLGMLTINGGVITDHISGTTFCDSAKTSTSTCGA